MKFKIINNIGLEARRKYRLLLKISIIAGVLGLLLPVILSNFIYEKISDEYIKCADAIFVCVPFVTKMELYFADPKLVAVCAMLSVPLIMVSVAIFSFVVSYGVSSLDVISKSGEGLSKSNILGAVLGAGVGFLFLATDLHILHGGNSFIGLITGKNIISPRLMMPIVASAVRDRGMIPIVVPGYAFTVFSVYAVFFVFLSHPIKFMKMACR